jgi:GAF domain-containing protein
MPDDAARVAELEAALRTARDQLAIECAENAALRERETATAELLRIIASSPTDLQRVLDTIATSAATLCEATNGSVWRIVDGELHNVASLGRARSRLGDVFPVSRGSVTGRAVVERQTQHVLDVLAITNELTISGVRTPEKPRTMISTPFLREGVVVGAITMYRREVRAFTESQVTLLQTFADQAVIAIENARLFEELERSNGELTQALEQQTATADILRVIAGSPSDLQPIFDAIVNSACRLSRSAWVELSIQEGDEVRITAGVEARSLGRSPRVGQVIDLGLHQPGNVAIRSARTIHISDRSLPEFSTEYPTANAGPNATLHVPLLLDGRGIGNITLGRQIAEPYKPDEIALVETFANQAAGRGLHPIQVRRDRAGAGDQPPLLPTDGRRPDRRERLRAGLDVHRAAAGRGGGRRTAGGRAWLTTPRGSHSLRRRSRPSALRSGIFVRHYPMRWSSRP